MSKNLCMKKIIFLVFFLSFFWFSNAQNQEVPFTLADRDRIIQTEVKVESLSKEIGSLRNEMGSLRSEMDAKFEAVNAKIDYMYWVQGVIIALIIFMLGYMIWDRRTALDPVKTDVEILKRENEKYLPFFIGIAASASRNA